MSQKMRAKSNAKRSSDRPVFFKRLATRVCVLMVSLVLTTPVFADEAITKQSTSEEDSKLIASVSSPSNGYAELTEHAREAAKLMGIEHDAQRLIDLKNAGRLEVYDKDTMKLQLDMVRKIMSTGLQLRVVSAQFDREITLERQALDQVTRNRDLTVAVLNDINFLQLGIGSTIIDGPLGITTKKRYNLYGDRLNIVSGLAVGSLAFLSLCAQRGGVRQVKSDPNLLGQAFELPTPASEHLPPILWNYFNSLPPNSSTGLTRREQLIKYWESTKVLPVNIKKDVTVERVSGYGPEHHRRCETIKLMTARISMLFDLRALIDRLNTGLVELLQAID